jgi:hypothetical protein
MDSSANDYSRLGAVKPTEGYDYTAHMEYCKDERNWFKRARGEWPEEVLHGAHELEGEDTQEG